MIKIGEKYSFMKAYFKIFVIFYLVNHVNAFHMGYNEPAVARGIMAAYKPISKGVNYLKSAMNTLIPKKPIPVDNKDMAPQPAAVPAQPQPLATNPLAPKVSPKNYNPIKAGKNFLKAAINSIMPKKHVPVINPVPSPRPVEVPIPQPVVVPKQTPVPNPYPDPVPVVDPDNSRIVQPYEVPVNVDVPVPQPYDNPIPVDKPNPVANPIPRDVPNPVPVDVPVPIPKNVPTPVKTPMEIPVPYPKIKIIPKPISVAGLAKKIPFLKPFFKDKKPKKSPEETTPPSTTVDPDSQSATKKSPEPGAKQPPESPETPAPDNPKEVGFDTPKPPFSFNFRNPFKNQPSKKSSKEPSSKPESESEEPPQKYGPPGRTGEDTPSPREAEKSSPQPSPGAPDQQEPDLPNIPEDQGPNGPVSGLGLPPMQLDKNVPKRTPGQGEKILEPKAGDKAPTGPNSKQTGALPKTDAEKEGDLQGSKQGDEEKAQEGKPDTGLLPKWLNEMFKWPFSEIPSNYPSKFPTSAKKDPKGSYSTVPAKKPPTDDLKEYIDSIPIVPSQKPLKEKPSTFDKFSGEPAEKDLVLDTTFPELDDKSRDYNSVKDNKKKRKNEKVKKPGKRKQKIDRKKRSRDLKKRLPLIYDQEFLETSPKIPKKYETALFSDKNILRISKDCLLLCDKKRRSESSSSSTESSTISTSSIDDENMKLSDSESEMTTGRKRKRLIRIENRCVCPPKKDCVKMIKKVNVKQSNNKKF